MATENIVVPDIGGAENVDVIEIFVSNGDSVAKDDSLITLESDKATMEIPSPIDGIVKEVKIKTGDKISEGGLILVLEAEAKLESKPEKPEPESTPEPEPKPESKPEPKLEAKPEPKPESTPTPSNNLHASPIVRRLAREFDLDLSQITPSGDKARITKTDITNFIKNKMSSGGSGSGMGLPSAPSVDFSQFGETEVKDLKRIKKISAQNLHRNWVLVPHVTQFDEADVTELEAFRKANKKMAEDQGAKLTPLVFLMKAVVAALKQYPEFNSSLSADGQQLILKKYFHIGVAMDTPNGLVVAVIRDVDKKSLIELAIELAATSKKAREKGLSVNDMQGSCFTISSLGGIGGTAFTPIVNLPDVAILGVSRSSMKPVWNGAEFEPRLMLPLSLSYDHRVIDGAEAARFTTTLSHLLTDVRRLLL